MPEDKKNQTRFKNYGFIVMESIDGDVFFGDKRFNSSLVLTDELIQKAVDGDSEKAVMVVKKINDFLKQHKKDRWELVKKELKEIEEKQPDFITEWRASCLEVGDTMSLIRLEKDVFFYKYENGLLDERTTEKINNKRNAKSEGNK